MEPVDWGQAWNIVGGGLLTTFSIMALLAVFTQIMGKFFVAAERRKATKQGAGEARR